MGDKNKKLEVENKTFLKEIISRKKEDIYSKYPKALPVSMQDQRVGLSKYPSFKISDGSRFRELFGKRKQRIKLIAEIKFASPTNPHIGSPKELLQKAKAYNDFGADAISLITEKYFFKGNLSSIIQVKRYVSLPILQKDFVIDEVQISEAKEIGSDALLLIARLVPSKKLTHFVELCFSLGIEPVVEVGDEADLEKAIKTQTKIIAVNARNLKTFVVNVQKACSLLKKIPNSYIKLGFSGIHSSSEVLEYKKAGAQGILIGTSLMQTKDIENFLGGLDK